MLHNKPFIPQLVLKTAIKWYPILTFHSCDVLLQIPWKKVFILYSIAIRTIFVFNPSVRGRAFVEKCMFEAERTVHPWLKKNKMVTCKSAVLWFKPLIVYQQTKPLTQHLLYAHNPTLTLSTQPTTYFTHTTQHLLYAHNPTLTLRTQPNTYFT